MIAGERSLGNPNPQEQAELTQDRLFETVFALAEVIGPRSVYVPEALATARNFLVEQFTGLGYPTRLEPFKVKPGLVNKITRQGIDFEANVENVIAEKMGTEFPEEMIILGAHYDTPGNNTPGANDNGSGVAVMLEVARRLRDVDLKKTVRFASFVNEEPPFTFGRYMGSSISAKRSRERGEKIVAMISLDEIGCFENRGVSSELSAEYMHGIPTIRPESLVFVTYGPGIGLLNSAVRTFKRNVNVPVDEVVGKVIVDPRNGFIWPDPFPLGWSDHAPYLGKGIPAVLVTDTGPFRNGRYYHTNEDLPETVDFDTLTKITDGITEVIRDLANQEPRRGVTLRAW